MIIFPEVDLFCKKTSHEDESPEEFHAQILHLYP